jgi:hypothetical protein
VQPTTAWVARGVHEHEVRGRIVARVAVDVVQLAGAGRDALAAAGAAPALLACEPGAVSLGRVPVETAGRVPLRPADVLFAAAAVYGHAGAAGFGAGAGCAGERHGTGLCPAGEHGRQAT